MNQHRQKIIRHIRNISTAGFWSLDQRLSAALASAPSNIHPYPLAAGRVRVREAVEHVAPAAILFTQKRVEDISATEDSPVCVTTSIAIYRARQPPESSCWPGAAYRTSLVSNWSAAARR